MIREADIEMPEQGLVLVVGDNKASEGFMQSVGAGKTSIGEGLCRALLGCNGRASTITSYSTHKKGNTYLRVEATVRGTPLDVELGYKCPELEGAGEALRYQYGTEEAVRRGTLAQTREELAAIVNITPRVSDWTVLVDGDRIKFNQISQQDSVNLVMESLNQPAWTVYHSRAKTIADELKLEHDTAVSTRENLEGSIVITGRRIEEARQDIAKEEKTYNDRIQKQTANIKEQAQLLEDLKTEAEEVEAKRAKVAAKVEELADKDAKAQHGVEIKINDLNDKLRKARETYTACVSKVSEAKNYYNNAADALDDLEAEPDECPKCGKPWDKEHSKEEIDQAASVLEKAENSLKKAKKTQKAAKDKCDSLEDEIEAEREKLKNLSGDAVKKLSQRDKDLEADLKDINQECRDAEIKLTELKQPVDDSDLKVARSQLKEREEQKKEQVKKLEELGDTVIETQQALETAQYWLKAFGPTGIPNMVLEDAIQPLNEVSTSLSKRMTGGVLAVKYSTQRQLARGGSKSQLLVEVDNKYGSADVKMGSKGESGLTNFFMSETLGEVGSVGNRIGFKWYDEVVPHHDSTLCQTIYGYMKEQAHRKNMLIFLVDHNPVAENFADHILVVEKGADASRVYWR